MKANYLLIAFFLFTQIGFAQDNTLTGILLDVNNKVIKKYPVTLGKTLPVTVNTDKNGVFIFPNANLQDTLYVGDKKGKNPIAIPVNGSAYVTIKSLKGNFNTQYLSEPDAQLLRYLQQMESDNRRKDSNSLTKEEIKLSGCRDIRCLLGRFVGVSMSTDGQVQIAGINSSIRGSIYALIVIDGIPNGGNLDDIPVEDIEDITVLKDGSMYGARGANGVIVVNLQR